MSNMSAGALELDPDALLASLQATQPPQCLSDTAVEASYVLAHDALTSGDLDSARVAFEFLAGQRPGEARMWAGLGYALLEAAQAEQALPALVLATQLDPDNAGYMMAMGRALAAADLSGHAAYAFGIAEAMARAAGDTELADRARGRLELMGFAS